MDSKKIQDSDKTIYDINKSVVRLLRCKPKRIIRKGNIKIEIVDSDEESNELTKQVLVDSYKKICQQPRKPSILKFLKEAPTTSKSTRSINESLRSRY